MWCERRRHRDPQRHGTAHPLSLPSMCLRGKASGSDATGPQKHLDEGFDVGVNGKTTKARAAAASAEERGDDKQPTHDHQYLLERINEGAKRKWLTMAVIQACIRDYGMGPVSDALRSMRFLTAEKCIEAPIPYLKSVLKSRAADA